MIKLLKIFTAVSVMLVNGVAMSQSEASFDSPVGEWIGEYESMRGKWKKDTTTIESESLATITNPDGRVYFYSVNEQGRWEGIWVEDSAADCMEKKHGSNTWGVSVFQFNDSYTEYEGTWDMCGKGKKYKQKGVRK